jgi:anaerobic glycerol-3-phosphate dehydrogenase
MRSVDVLVIGGGIAGAAAAVAAAAQGAGVLLVRRGPGVTALGTGGWLDAPPEPLAAALAAAGLPLAECNGALPHPDGFLVPCARAPHSHARAAIAGGAERALVCGIAGLPSFRPRALARLWADACGLDTGALEPVVLTVEATPAAGWSPISLAAALEREPRLLGAPLAHALRERGAARAIVPAVLGLDEHAPTHAAVEEIAGVAVGEALGVAPSMPGWRLDRALLHMLANARVEVITAAAVLADDGVWRLDGAAQSFVRTASVVMATGKFAGGGLAAEPALRDIVRGADVAIERLGIRFTDASDSLTLTELMRSDVQPLLTAGTVESDGVVVAGSARAGSETAALGLGAAAADGWSAGKRAAEARAA